MGLRVAELETLWTANTDQIAAAERTVKATGERIEKKPIKQKVDADDKGFVESMRNVEATSKRIVSAKTIATVDANIERAEKGFMRAFERLEYLKSVDTELDVKADISRAEAQLQRVERQMNGLRAARAVMEVRADTDGAEKTLDGLEGKATAATGKAGDAGGRSFVKSMDSATRGAGERVGDAVGSGVEESLTAALTAIPVAGGIILAAVAIGKAVTGAIQDGLQVEVRQDRLQALTGIDEAAARKLGYIAGNAYANNFGESIEANMDAARLGLQFRIIDPTTSARDAQQVVESLSGIAGVLGEDVEPVARTVTQLLRTGLARSAKEAFDLLAAGGREGVNIGGDLLDTYNEYATQFRKLGIDGPQSLGLLSQALRAGARDSDVAADALKEFAIRAVDPAMAERFQAVGFSWTDLSQRIARGGPEAAAALDETLDKLRAIEDPAQRDAAAMELFGTKSEDMAAALLAMDLTSAVDEIGQVEGAAQRMFDTLDNNDAGRMERAQRNIEVATEGIKGALAQALGDPLADLADFVSQNRGPVLQFFLDLANGALDFGDSVVEGIAAGTESVGAFVSGPLADLTRALGKVIGTFDAEAGMGLQLEAFRMSQFEESTSKTADQIRTNLGGALDEARGKLNTFGEGAVAFGFLNDASLRLADAVATVGDGTASMEAQVRSAAEALYEEQAAAAAAGESQEVLAERYAAGKQALEDQMVASGMAREEARLLIEQILKTPAQVKTMIDLETATAERNLTSWITSASGRRIQVKVDAVGGVTYTNAGSNISYQARGSVLEFMAAGGVRGGTPMDRLAQMVPPATYRVVGDRTDVPELFAPLDGSARSWALLMEGFRRMPGGPPKMGDGGITTTAQPIATPSMEGPLVLQLEDGTTLSGYIRRQAAAVTDELTSTFRGGMLR